MSENEKENQEQDIQDPQLQYASAEDLDALASSTADLGETGEAIEPDPLADLHAKLAESEKRCLIAQADLENFRRRNRKETQDKLKHASGPLMTDLLEAVDNLQRAVEAFEKEKEANGSDPHAGGGGEALNEGVKLVAAQIQDVLSKHGCKPIEAVGQPFDPNLHQALQMQASDEYPEQTVMMDLRRGFTLHERVLRPSQVFVSTGPA